MSYLNRAQKETIFSLGGVKGFCDELSTTAYISSPEDKKRLSDISKTAFDLMTSLMSGVDPDQLKGVTRFTDNATLLVVPNTSPKCNDDVVLVDRNVLTRILKDTITECWFCEKNGIKIKQCQRRKDMLECGLMGDGKDCPFQI